MALWAFISLHFSFLGLHFLAFWHFGPSFPCILALWAFISLHFGLVGFHFLAFLPFRGQLLGSSPQVAKNGLFAQRPYNGFISAVTGTILQFLAFWAFISLHFGIVGFHFLVFWPRGPSFPCIFAFSGSASGVLPTSCQKWPVCPTSLQWIYQRRNRLHFAVFNLLGLYFLAFWPCGPSFPCLLALWAFISLRFAVFSLLGLHFLAFWPCGLSFPCILASWAFISLHFCRFGVSFWAPPASCQKWPVCPTSLQWIYQRRDRLHFAVFSLLGLHFLAFWHCGPSFPSILAFWAFISLHFGLVGLHFLAFWPFRLSFPCMLALWAFIPCNFLGRQLRRNRQRADPSRCPISESFCLM